MQNQPSTVTTSAKEAPTIQYNIGNSKYVVNFHTGKTNADGSKFYDVAIFSNKKKMKSFIGYLIIKGYLPTEGDLTMYKNARTTTAAYKKGFSEGVVALSQKDCPYSASAYVYTDEGLKREGWINGFCSKPKEVGQ